MGLGSTKIRFRFYFVVKIVNGKTANSNIVFINIRNSFLTNLKLNKAFEYYRDMTENRGLKLADRQLHIIVRSALV